MGGSCGQDTHAAARNTTETMEDHLVAAYKTHIPTIALLGVYVTHMHTDPHVDVSASCIHN